MKSESYNKQREENNIKKWGATYPQKTEQVKKLCEENNIKKWGFKSTSQSPLVKKKQKQTEFEKYGCWHNSIPEIKEKQIKSKREKYGEKLEKITEKTKETLKERYNDEKFNNREKASQTVLEKYGVDYTGQRHIKNYVNYNKEFIISNFTTNGIMSLIQRAKFQEYFGIISNTHSVLNRFGINYEVSNIKSPGEEVLFDYIKSITKYKVTKNRRDVIFNPETNFGLELDIYIEKLKLAVEYNGVYWHGLREEQKENSKDLLKTKLCEEKGITLIHYYNNEDFNIFKRYIKNKIRKLEKLKII